MSQGSGGLPDAASSTAVQNVGKGAVAVGSATAAGKVASDSASVAASTAGGAAESVAAGTGQAVGSAAGFSFPILATLLVAFVLFWVFFD